jgi:hypothetical protein
MTDAALRSVAATIAVVASFIWVGLFAAFIVTVRRNNKRRAVHADKR